MPERSVVEVDVDSFDASFDVVVEERKEDLVVAVEMEAVVENLLLVVACYLTFLKISFAQKNQVTL